MCLMVVLIKWGLVLLASNLNIVKIITAITQGNGFIPFLYEDAPKLAHAGGLPAERQGRMFV